MNYYGGSLLPTRWTSQHNCGENNDCQFIIQYACEGQLGENIRDGYPQDINGNTCTQTIPEEPDSEITTLRNMVKMKIMGIIKDVRIGREIMDYLQQTKI